MQVEPHAFKAKMTSNLNTQPSHVCRKMGKAYLEHSIAELESQLRQVRMQNPPGPVGGRPCLLDISTLIYALPVVKKWARGDDYAELLLPVDALAMLDILKKAEQPLASQAREAIRWLERQLASEGTSTIPSQHRQRTRSRLQLRLLKEEDMLSWSEVVENSSLPALCSQSGGDEEQNAGILQKHALWSPSLGRQTTLRGLLRQGVYSSENLCVAYADTPSAITSQSDLVKRLLADEESMDQVLRYFPAISAEALVRISGEDAAKAAEDEAKFRDRRRARHERGLSDGIDGQQRPTGNNVRREGRFKRPDSGYHNSGNRTPSSSTSSERSPISDSFTNSPLHSPRSTASLPSSRNGILQGPTLPTSNRMIQETEVRSMWQRQPTRRQAGASNGQVEPITLAHTGFRDARGGKESRIASYATKDKTHLAPAPKVTLANPGSTARSLSTAT